MKRKKKISQMIKLIRQFWFLAPTKADKDVSRVGILLRLARWCGWKTFTANAIRDTHKKDDCLNKLHLIKVIGYFIKRSEYFVLLSEKFVRFIYTDSGKIYCAQYTRKRTGNKKKTKNQKGDEETPDNMRFVIFWIDTNIKTTTANFFMIINIHAEMKRWNN